MIWYYQAILVEDEKNNELGPRNKRIQNRVLDSRWWRLRTKVVRVTGNTKYLGVIITSDGNSNQEIKSRIEQAKTATRKLNNLLRCTHITKRNNTRMYKAIVESILLYGAELWETNTQNQSYGGGLSETML